jgi:hypothetical protein
MLTAYRIAYGLVVVVFLGNVLTTKYFALVTRWQWIPVIALLASFGCLLALVIGLTRLRPQVFWGFTIFWLVLFVWYGWFGPTAPFELHEIHTFDPAQALHERHVHNLIAGCIFAALSLWFLSLSVVRSRMLRQE